MVNVYALPEQFRAKAERIPSQVLRELSAVEATARVIAAERWTREFTSNPDPVTARGAAELAHKVLTAPAGDVAGDFRAKAAACGDPVLRSGYFAAAEEHDGEHPAPTAADIEAAKAAVSAFSASLSARKAAPRRMVRKTTSSAGNSDLERIVAREVAAATAHIDRRTRELQADLAAARAQVAADRAANPSAQVMTKESSGMLLKSAPAEAGRYRRLADEVTDPAARRGYLALAEQAEGGVQ
ncbi:hypothetical protein ORV05_05375 [Amycolatopsis cynarae]|uniref:Uncharacterized protein n=1 Tax=Amycolatopsis cynarae TaxID=2995223 RepID=A0ABY7B5J6_9PSEU|nr:hypothetical protein [Amycolatopsis sp. HUAS 11-8]WAL67220.1 hypothetical protein ORV05_05375 [Amycolatopsis sp. HUAS 11-8]